MRCFLGDINSLFSLRERSKGREQILSEFWGISYKDAFLGWRSSLHQEHYLACLIGWRQLDSLLTLPSWISVLRAHSRHWPNSSCSYTTRRQCSSFSVFSPLHKDLIEDLLIFICILNKYKSGRNSPAFFREGGTLHLRSLFLEPGRQFSVTCLIP